MRRQEAPDVALLLAVRLVPSMLLGATAVACAPPTLLPLVLVAALTFAGECCVDRRSKSSGCAVRGATQNIVPAHDETTEAHQLAQCH